MKIRTDDGKLMRHRLRKLLRDDEVVFLDVRLVDELLADLNELMTDTYEPWVIDLMRLKCGDDLALIDSMMAMMQGDESDRRENAVQYAKICFTCREIWLKAVNEVRQMPVVQLYAECWKAHENLKQEYQALIDAINADY
ncbi:hypothetical protein IKF94_03230 [Candidatus Saccharibacteria bacterium]|nr:hypothetical protein [Candidatus Saccharibacteria bacterium]